MSLYDHSELLAPQGLVGDHFHTSVSPQGCEQKAAFPQQRAKPFMFFFPVNPSRDSHYQTEVWPSAFGNRVALLQSLYNLDNQAEIEIGGCERMLPLSSVSVIVSFNFLEKQQWFGALIDWKPPAMVQGDAKALIRLVVSGAVSGTKTQKNWKKMNVSSCSKKKSQKAKDSQMTLMAVRWVICSGSKTWCAGRTEQQQNIREHGLCRAPLNGCWQINQEIHFLVQSKWKRKNNQYFSWVKKKKSLKNYFGVSQILRSVNSFCFLCWSVI